MADVTFPPRLAPLTGISTGIASMSVTAPRRRLTLHLREGARANADGALGFSLPQALRATVQGERAALWMGPEETLILSDEADDLAPALEAALKDVPHALVDVSHRQIGLLIEGERAADALNTGCPLDLSEAAFPVGMCTRTIYHKAEIVLWRLSSTQFHVEVWRSFAPYVWELLDEARREAA
ncbi:sarcosine oxidase subunit gamma [Granulibacter bethesdensis]|nr:sarcosine oxidase subunit gamma family protein [Granulibacter bethesdensis]